MLRWSIARRPRHPSAAHRCPTSVKRLPRCATAAPDSRTRRDAKPALATAPTAPQLPRTSIRCQRHPGGRHPARCGKRCVGGGIVPDANVRLRTRADGDPVLRQANRRATARKRRRHPRRAGLSSERSSGSPVTSVRHPLRTPRRSGGRTSRPADLRGRYAHPVECQGFSRCTGSSSAGSARCRASDCSVLFSLRRLRSCVSGALQCYPQGGFVDDRLQPRVVCAGHAQRSHDVLLGDVTGKGHDGV